MPAPAPWAMVMMHLLFAGMIHSAETEPIVGDIFSDNERVFIDHWFACVEGKKYMQSNDNWTFE